MGCRYRVLYVHLNDSLHLLSSDFLLSKACAFISISPGNLDFFSFPICSYGLLYLIFDRASFKFQIIIWSESLLPQKGGFIKKELTLHEIFANVTVTDVYGESRSAIK